MELVYWLNVVFAMAACLLLWFSWKGICSHRKRVEKQAVGLLCPYCFYKTSDLPEHRCPECGRKVADIPLSLRQSRLLINKQNVRRVWVSLWLYGVACGILWPAIRFLVAVRISNDVSEMIAGLKHNVAIIIASLVCGTALLLGIYRAFGLAWLRQARSIFGRRTD